MSRFPKNNSLFHFREKIFVRDPSVVADYYTLNAEERRGLIENIAERELMGLTSLLKESKKKAFQRGERRFQALTQSEIATPVYVIDEALMEENMRIMQYVKDRTGCKILHALKAYATYATFSLMRQYLDGVCASGLYEARLGYEEFGKEVHTFSVAYREEEFDEILKYSQVVIFNSFPQLRKFASRVKAVGVEVGVRVNPGYSEVETAMYNPCLPYSRLGVIHEIFEREYPAHKEDINGLHFHVLCEQNADVLKRVVDNFEKLYGKYLINLKWVNFGGGHHISRDDYELETLINLINTFQKKYGVTVYLEPGEANVLLAGVLISKVLDIVRNEREIAIMDASAEAHMPDVLLMPYRPHVLLSGAPYEKEYTYRLAGPTCLAGDIIGDYSFDAPLRVGDKLVFTDMAHYSIVKNNMFNGINLPDIALMGSDGNFKVIRKFTYADYKARLA